MIDRTQTQGELPPPPPPSAIDAPPGYAIERPLGEGGMGVVVLARQAGLNRPVALKMVRAGMAVDPKALIRFLAEAEAVAAVRHPNVVEVYAYGDHNGRPYLAMEFCPGGSLADRLKAGDRPDPRGAAKLVAAVADGVGAAHALSIVHRDLKPGNVLLTAAGEPKVSDFGLAKRGAGQDLTHTGAVMGTPAYMSPEQAGGGAKFVGPAADVWALGVMLYELLTGTRPFDGGSTDEVLAKVLNGRPAPVRTHLPGVPRDLELIFEKCLEREPADRYPDAAEVAADLRRFLAGQPTKARPVPAAVRATKWAKRNKPLAGALAAAVVAMAAGTGVSVWQADRAEREAQRAEERAGELSNALATVQHERNRTTAALSVANDEVAFANFTLARIASDSRSGSKSSRNHLERVPADHRGFEWNWLTRLDSNGLCYEHGSISKLRPSIIRELGCLTWSADNNNIIYANAGKALIVDPAKRRTPTLCDAAALPARLIIAKQTENMRWKSQYVSPCGRFVVSYSDNGRVIEVRHVSTMNIARVFRGAGDLDFFCAPAWSPDGSRLALSSYLSHSVRVLNTEDWRIVEDYKNFEIPITNFSYSADGRRLAAVSEYPDRVNIHVLDQRSPPILALRTTYAATRKSVISPDGTMIAHVEYDGTIKICKTYAQYDDTVLDFTGYKIGAVAWSPDAKKIAIEAKGANSITTVIIYNANTSLLSTVSGVDWGIDNEAIAWSRDGTKMAVGDFTTTLIYNADTGIVVGRFGHPAEARGRISALCWSPEGGRLAYGTHSGMCVVRNAQTGKTLSVLNEVNEHVHSLDWSPDGSAVIVGQMGNGSNTPAQVFDATTGSLIHELHGCNDDVLYAGWSPDGLRLSTYSEPDGLQLWHARSGRLIIKLPSPGGDEPVESQVLRDVKWSRDGSRIFSLTSSGRFCVWDGSPVSDQCDDFEKSRRYWYNHLQPSYHAYTRHHFEKYGNQFAAAIQASLEQRAIAQQLFDAGQFQGGSWHLVAAELNSLKSRQHIASPPSPHEPAPPPRPARDVTTPPR